MKRLTIRREALAPLTDDALAAVAGGTVDSLRCPGGPLWMGVTPQNCITGYCTNTVICEA